jgi:hypothetical protein
MHRRSLLRPVFRYPHSSHRMTWPGPVLPWPRRRSWGSTLRGVAPARGCRDVSVPRTHLPFSDPPRPIRGRMLRIEPAGQAPSPTMVKEPPTAGTGRGSWASSPRAVRSGPCATLMRRRAPRPCGAGTTPTHRRDVRPIPPWAFSSLRFSNVSVGHRFRPLPLVGFAVRARRDSPARLPARQGRSAFRCRLTLSRDVVVILSNGHG